jgi:hypothetical protein
MTTLVATSLLVAGALGLVVPAAADEAKTPVRAMMLINSVVGPMQIERQTAFDEALKREGPPPPRRATDGEVQPDGSVRYGNATVTVKNPCPPGEHYEPPPLPGRRARK